MKKSDIERFEKKYSIENGIFGCWEWLTGKSAKGYGAFSINNNNIAAHRFSFMISNGVIPRGLLVRHKCDNRCCVNPLHLELGTELDNRQDAVKRNRIPRKEDHHTVKISLEDCLEIKRLSKTGFPDKELADIYKINRRLVNSIKNGKHWSNNA